MRIAVSAEGKDGLASPVSGHFGRCPYFVVVDVEEGEIQKVDTLENPFYANHVPGGVPGFIQQLRAHVMLAGGMGGRAAQMFASMGIGVATGASGTVEQAVQAYLDGTLQGFEPCSDEGHHHHGGGGGCGRHEA